MVRDGSMDDPTEGAGSAIKNVELQGFPAKKISFGRTMARLAWVAALLPASALATSSSVATVELAGEIESVMGQPWAVIDSMSEFFETEHLGAMVDDWAKAGSLMFALLRSYWYDPAIYMMCAAGVVLGARLVVGEDLVGTPGSATARSSASTTCRTRTRRRA